MPPANTGGGRFCRGRFDGVDVSLGDGDDSLTSGVGGTVDGGPGDDQIRTGGAFSTLSGGPGADLLDATASQGAAVTYADHTDGVTVRLNGVADDGAAGEGDNVLGPVTGITGGSGNDDLQAGPSMRAASSALPATTRSPAAPRATPSTPETATTPWPAATATTT